MAKALFILVLALLTGACGDDATSLDAGTDSAAPPGDSGGDSGGGDSGGTDSGGADDGAVDAGPETDSGAPLGCDYRDVDGIVVIEAESLPLVEDWEVATEHAGFTGSGYIQWAGDSHNNDPTHGVMEVDLCLSGAGRYRLQWHARIGLGSNATEHNDSWFQFADTTGYFGARGPSDGETRRYAHPTCDDDVFMGGIRALPTVTGATCVAGSSRDGWLKVYSSGATDWRWSTNTSDSDAHAVVFEVDGPGVVTLMLAARADFNLMDRLVIHDASLDDAVVQDLTLPETPAP